jgi:hypothetical protein
VRFYPFLRGFGSSLLFGVINFGSFSYKVNLFDEEDANVDRGDFVTWKRIRQKK